jgi:hypothetical protein
MSTKSYSLVKGRRVRVTKLDNCGRPVYGDSSSAVTKGFISVGMTANTTESDEINVQNAAGETCVFEPAETSLTGYAVEVQFCEVDPELFAIATNQTPYEDYEGNIIGFAVESGVEMSSFALELWAGVAGGDACENPDAEGQYGYLLLPFLRGGIVGDLTIENGAATFTITGANTRDGANWGTGPYPVILNGSSAPSVLPTALSKKTHFLNILVDVEPPAPAVGARPVLDPATDPLTAIVATDTGLSVSLALTPNDITAPVWIEWGDGEWSYETDTLAPATHVYAAAGTYTIRASTSGTWVETTVTVSA